MSSNKNIDDKFYLIYRTSDDRHGGIDNFYGWSTNKSIINAFLKQRSKKKYIVQKEFDIDSNVLRPELMIDILLLKSCQSGEIIKFFTTEEEKERITKDINSMFDVLRTFDRIDDENIFQLVNLFNNLDEKYIEALSIIGYKPMEVTYICDRVDDMYDGEGGIDSISFDSEDEYNTVDQKYSHDPAKVIIFSLESVIKVLKDDL